MACAFPHQATLLSILQAYPECYEWIYSNYIQIFSARHLNEGPGVIAKFDFFHSLYCDYKYFELRTNPWLQYYKLPLYMLLELEDIVTFLIKRIDNEEYIWLPVQTDYIEYYPYQWFHVQLIYGYNLERKVFFCGDNYNGKYSFEEVPFESIELAIKGVTNDADLDLGTEGVTLLKHYFLPKWNDKFSRYKFNMNKVINDIKEYLLLDDYGMGYRKNEFYCFGIECYDALENYYKIRFSEEKSVDLRAISSLLDHKNIMCNRLQYFYENNYIKDSKLISRYKSIYNNIIALRNLLIKINTIHAYTKERLELVCLRLQECKRDEIKLLKDILLEIE